MDYSSSHTLQCPTQHSTKRKTQNRKVNCINDGQWLVFSLAMHHSCHRRTPLLTALLVLQTSSAATIWPTINEKRSLQGRAQVDVLKDKYFIPAIAAIGVFVILALICCYWLGWCFNSRRVDRYYSRTAHPTPGRLMIRSPGIANLRVGFLLSATTTNTRPINLDAVDGADAELDKEIARRTSSVQRKATPPSTQGSIPGSPVSTSTAQVPPGVHHPTNSWQQYGYSGSPQWPQAAPVSHGFQTIPATSHVPSMMSVQHLNPTASHYMRPHLQPPATTQAPGQSQTQFRSDFIRASTVSSADSSTQIGSAAGDQVPYVYSPHQGNTLSYVSSAPTAQGIPRTSDLGNTMPPPQDGSFRPDPQIQPTRATSPPTGPPAYIADGSGYPQDKKSGKKGG